MKKKCDQRLGYIAWLFQLGRGSRFCVSLLPCWHLPAETRHSNTTCMFWAKGDRPSILGDTPISITPSLFQLSSV